MRIDKIYIIDSVPNKNYKDKIVGLPDNHRKGLWVAERVMEGE